MGVLRSAFGGCAGSIIVPTSGRTVWGVCSLGFAAGWLLSHATPCVLVSWPASPGSQHLVSARTLALARRSSAGARPLGCLVLGRPHLSCPCWLVLTTVLKRVSVTPGLAGRTFACTKACLHQGLEKSRLGLMGVGQSGPVAHHLDHLGTRRHRPPRLIATRLCACRSSTPCGRTARRRPSGVGCKALRCSRPAHLRLRSVRLGVWHWFWASFPRSRPLIAFRSARLGRLPGGHRPASICRGRPRSGRVDWLAAELLLPEQGLAWGCARYPPAFQVACMMRFNQD